MGRSLRVQTTKKKKKKKKKKKRVYRLQGLLAVAQWVEEVTATAWI